MHLAIFILNLIRTIYCKISTFSKLTIIDGARVVNDIHSKIPKIVLGGLGARPLLGGSGRAFSLEVASFAPTYKFSEAPEALRARFFTRLGRFGTQTCSPERPRPRLSSPKQQFLRGFSVRRAFDTQNVRHQKNTVKTNTKRVSEVPRIDRKSIKN